MSSTSEKTLCYCSVVLLDEEEMLVRPRDEIVRRMQGMDVANASGEVSKNEMYTALLEVRIQNDKVAYNVEDFIKDTKARDFVQAYADERLVQFISTIKFENYGQQRTIFVCYKPFKEQSGYEGEVIGRDYTIEERVEKSTDFSVPNLNSVASGLLERFGMHGVSPMQRQTYNEKSTILEQAVVNAITKDFESKRVIDVGATDARILAEQQGENSSYEDYQRQKMNVALANTGKVKSSNVIDLDTRKVSEIEADEAKSKNSLFNNKLTVNNVKDEGSEKVMNLLTRVAKAIVEKKVNFINDVPVFKTNDFSFDEQRLYTVIMLEGLDNQKLAQEVRGMGKMKFEAFIKGIEDDRKKEDSAKSEKKPENENDKKDEQDMSEQDKVKRSREAQQLSIDVANSDNPTVKDMAAKGKIKEDKDKTFENQIKHIDAEVSKVIKKSNKQGKRDGSVKEDVDDKDKSGFVGGKEKEKGKVKGKKKENDMDEQNSEENESEEDESKSGKKKKSKPRKRHRKNKQTA